jgi:hypothetical protein
MSAAVITAALGVFALWMWGHLSFSFIFHIAGGNDVAPLRLISMKRADYIGMGEERQGEELIVCHAGS